MQIVPASPSASWAWPYPEVPGTFSVPGNVQLESLAPASSGCRFRLPGGEEVSLPIDGWQVINIRRRDRPLPYLVTCEEHDDRQHAGQKLHLLRWQPQYRAQGTLVLGDCSRLVVVFDLNGDGLFDRWDLVHGTALGVDVNNDGQIWGKGEYFEEGDVIRVCARSLEIASLSPTGDWIEFRESKLPQVRVGAPAPPFTLQTDDGKIVDSQNLRGRWQLVDFWASWCAPCMEEFSEVKKLGAEAGDRMGVYLVNVDDADRIEIAKQALAKYAFSYPKSWSGKGEDDTLWRTFGTTLDDHLTIPLYVLIDTDGRIALLTHDVKGLRATIFK
jgi:thiol-disulfide isomerase/thioredoxin